MLGEKGGGDFSMVSGELVKGTPAEHPSYPIWHLCTDMHVLYTILVYDMCIICVLYERKR